MENIKEQEFRIGNLVQDKDGVVLKVDGINVGGLMVSNADNMCYMEAKDLFPVPMSEQILIDAGFEPISGYSLSNEERGYIQRDGIKIHPSKHIYVRTVATRNNKDFFSVFNHSECDIQQIQYIKKVEFAHEFQNIFFE